MNSRKTFVDPAKNAFFAFTSLLIEVNCFHAAIITTYPGHLHLWYHHHHSTSTPSHRLHPPPELTRLLKHLCTSSTHPLIPSPQRPEAAILRAINSHKAYRRETRDIDVSLGQHLHTQAASTAQIEHRARRALRIETAIKWKLVSTPEEQSEEFRYFRVLPTLANDEHGRPADAVLESQLQMLKYVLSDFANAGGHIARLCLDNITDRHMRQCLEYTVVPPSDNDDADPGTMYRTTLLREVQAFRALQRRYSHQSRRSIAPRFLNERRRVEREVPSVEPTDLRRAISVPQSDVEFRAVGSVNDSDDILGVSAGSLPSGQGADYTGADGGSGGGSEGKGIEDGRVGGARNSSMLSSPLESVIVDGFDDSDYTLPVHLSKITFMNDVTDCVIRAWLEKRARQRERADADESHKFVVRQADIDDRVYARQYRRQFASFAIILVKFMLANGESCCFMPTNSDEYHAMACTD